MGRFGSRNTFCSVITYSNNIASSLWHSGRSNSSGGRTSLTTGTMAATSSLYVSRDHRIQACAIRCHPNLECPAEGYSGGQVRDSGGWARTWYDNVSRILGSLSHAHLRIAAAPRRAVELKKMVVGWTADGEPPPSDL